MKAIQYTRTGPPDVLQAAERELPQPGDGEVRVRIVVSGVNPTDWKSRAGGGEPRALSRPQVPNQDGSGVVDALGAGVSGLSPGQRVWVWDAAWQRADGTAQEQVVLPQRQVVALPVGASFDVGASLGIPALTAHRTLTARDDGPARLAPGALAGATVLVAGGAGAVGHAAIQLATWAGATVITTISSPAKAALVTAAGAAHVVNYREQDVAEAVRAIAPDGVDVIVEVNPAANLSLDSRLLAPGGTVAVYADDGVEQTVPIPVRPNMFTNARIQFVLTYTTTAAQKDDAVAAVAAAVADGALGVGADHGLPLHRFPLAETAAAHAAVEAGTIGKVLIDVTEA